VVDRIVYGTRVMIDMLPGIVTGLVVVVGLLLGFLVYLPGLCHRFVVVCSTFVMHLVLLGFWLFFVVVLWFVSVGIGFYLL
jgi:hypothetical protein